VKPQQVEIDFAVRDQRAMPARPSSAYGNTINGDRTDSREGRNRLFDSSVDTFSPFNGTYRHTVHEIPEAQFVLAH